MILSNGETYENEQPLIQVDHVLWNAAYTNITVETLRASWNAVPIAKLNTF